MDQEKELEKLRTQAAEKIFAAKKKKENLGQPKLSFKDGRLSVNFQKDPEMQARWDQAVFLYLSETFSSFRAKWGFCSMLSGRLENTRYKCGLM